MKVSIDTKKTYLVIFTLAWLAIGASILLKGWSTTWTGLHIPVLSPSLPFEDIRTVQGSLHSVDLGFNPQVKNPGDPWYRAMNYPIIWYWIAKLFHFEHETNLILFVCVYVLAYIAACFFLLRNSPSLYILLLAFSWPSLLAVERGNNDLLAFALLFTGITLSLSYFRAFSILLATVLKIYPALLVVTLVKNRKILIPLVLIIAGFFIFNSGELTTIQAGNTALNDPSSMFASYGFDTTMRNILLVIGSQSPTTYAIFKYTLILVSLLLIVILSRTEYFNLTSNSAYKTDLFISGAVIFSGTYLITSNWDYRLIFLLFCIPYILSIQNRFIKHSMLIGIFLSSNISFLYWTNLGQSVGMLSTTIKYFVFIAVSACLVKEIMNYVPVIILERLKLLHVAPLDRAQCKDTPWYRKPRVWLRMIVLLAVLVYFVNVAQKYFIPRIMPQYGTLTLHITGLRPPGNLIINLRADYNKNFSRSVSMAFKNTEMTYAVDVLYFGDYVIQVIHDENNNEIADLDSETGLFREGFGIVNMDKLDLRNAASVKAGNNFNNLKYSFDRTGETVKIKMYYPPFPWQHPMALLVIPGSMK